jgi:hypothetical protein
VFSLGIVLFELTTGYRLFRGRDDRHTLDLVNWGKIPRPSQVVEKYPPELEAIVMHALDRDIDKRYQTADDLRDALETYLVEQRIVVPSAGVKGLLRRVLGSRIDQRRQQIRAAIRALDGSNPGMTLVSEESVLTDADAISVSVSQVEAPNAGDLSSPSGLGAAWLPSDSSAGAHSVSQPSAPPRRSSPLGFVIGATVGIVGAAAAFVVLATRDTEPPVKESSPRPSSATGAAPNNPEPGPAGDDREPQRKQGYSIDSLPEEGEPLGAMGASPQKGGSAMGANPALPDNRPPEERLKKDIAALRPDKTKVVLEEDDPVADVANSVTLGEEAKRSQKPAQAGGIDRGAAGSALARAANMTGLCRRVGGQTGTGRVLVTIGPNGSVSGVSVQPPFAGTAVGSCVAAQFQRVTVPSFSGDPVILSKSFTIPE